MSTKSFKWYHANFGFRLASNLLLKPFYLIRGFVTFGSCHWMYLGTVDSFLSGSNTRTRELMFSCIFHGEIEGGLCCLIIKNFHVKISQNLSLHFWHNLFQVPRTMPGIQLCPGLWKYYISAHSMSNFSPLNALFLSILIILPVRLILWEGNALSVSLLQQRFHVKGRNHDNHVFSMNKPLLSGFLPWAWKHCKSINQLRDGQSCKPMTNTPIKGQQSQTVG